jgi:hypothetical protein
LFYRLNGIRVPHRHETFELGADPLCKGNRNVKIALPDGSKRISIGKILFRSHPHTSWSLASELRY